MSLSYNSMFFKIYCKFFAKFVGKDDYGNTYYTKKIIVLKIILEREGLLYIKVC